MSHYCLNCGTELEDNKYVCPQCHHNVYLDSIDEKIIQSSLTTLSAANIECNMQWTKYHCGKNGCTGHGFAAEDYNALCDMLAGATVEASGKNNKTDGSDRISNGTLIQVKYCATPRATVNAAFRNCGKGEYRYISDGKPQLLEVPSDQYEECIILMEDKIRNGQVKGVSDPADAKTIVKRGNCTYQQTLNMAKAGTIDSLVLDAKTGTIMALSSLGISFCVRFGLSALTCKSADELTQAAQLSFLEGLKNGTITFVTSIGTTQILRTQFGRDFSAFVMHITKDSVDNLYKTSIGKSLIHEMASDIHNKSLYGIAAQSTVKKTVKELLCVNGITAALTLTIISMPDTYRLYRGEISSPQFMKNLVVNTSGMVGATIGGILGLAFLGKPGSVAGGMIGATLANLLSKKVIDRIHRDDAEYMQELVKIAIVELANDYFIFSQQEFAAVMRNLYIDKVVNTNLLRAMYQVGLPNDNDVLRVDFAKVAMSYHFGVVARQRRQFKMSAYEKQLLSDIDKIDVKGAAIMA